MFLLISKHFQKQNKKTIDLGSKKVLRQKFKNPVSIPKLQSYPPQQKKKSEVSRPVISLNIWLLSFPPPRHPYGRPLEMRQFSVPEKWTGAMKKGPKRLVRGIFWG